MTLRIESRAPTGEPRYVVGPFEGSGLVAGEYGGFVEVNLPVVVRSGTWWQSSHPAPRIDRHWERSAGQVWPAAAAAGTGWSVRREGRRTAAATSASLRISRL